VIVYREWSEWASQLYRQVREAYDRLSHAAEDRATKLERCLHLRQFEDKASTVCASYFFIRINQRCYVIIICYLVRIIQYSTSEQTEMKTCVLICNNKLLIIFADQRFNAVLIQETFDLSDGQPDL